MHVFMYLCISPVFCGPGLLLHATELFSVDVLIHSRLSLETIAETVTSSDAMSVLIGCAL